MSDLVITHEGMAQVLEAHNRVSKRYAEVTHELREIEREMNKISWALFCDHPSESLEHKGGMQTTMVQCHKCGFTFTD